MPLSRLPSSSSSTFCSTNDSTRMRFSTFGGIAISVKRRQVASASVEQMVNGFVRWTLRTSGVDAARSFYDALLEEGAPDVSELPASLRARGAKPHWLGY